MTGRETTVARNAANSAAEHSHEETVTALEHLLKCTSSWIWETDVDDRLCRVVGGQPHQSLMRGARAQPLAIHEIFEAPSNVQPVKGLRAAMKTRRPFSGLVFRVTTEGYGEVSTLELSGVPRYDPGSGKFRGYFGMAQAVPANTTLLRRTICEERTRVREEFLSHVSHELRTPLNAIIGFSELLSGPSGKSIEQHRIREYADLVKGAGRHLLSIIDDMIEIVSYADDDASRVLENAPAKALIETAIERCANTYPEDAKRIETAIERELPMLKCEPRGVTQVLEKVLSNAIRFSPNDKPILVGAWRNESGRIIISVKDRGPGFAPDQIDRVTEPFGCGNAMLSRADIQGVGLSLSVCKTVVERHGGRFIIESVAGEGATIRTDWPSAGNPPIALGRSELRSQIVDAVDRDLAFLEG